ncbi:MAG: tRNA 2-thiouridine(34) synthase MnmA [Candidatus Bipolaricaulota bacterium]|nr:MAG: tRNA 2-thiouridine(34) synthase MnmA [Candidatus Bipolaricaulota bacterium]
MSGGVDSTVAALLLLRAGHEVEGVTFWFWDFPGAPDIGTRNRCCSIDDATIAASQLGIPHRVLDAGDRFYALVISEYLARYRRGKTPNPCGRCNRSLRFGLALEIAAHEGFDYVATGHHVRIAAGAHGRCELHRGCDDEKDQSYFLYGLQGSDLSRLLFPVGEMTKDAVFAIARAEGLHAADLPESQDLCFACEGSTDYLFDPEDLRTGPILDREGRRVGTHEGLPRYTIGQRRGLGISSSHPLYVIALDAERNALIVGQEEDLLSDGLTADDASFLDGTGPEEGAWIEVKIRYRSAPEPAAYSRLEERCYLLHFGHPLRAVTPGQLAVLYDGDRLLGGGTIAEATSADG